MAELVARTSATAYLPEGAGVDFEHRPLTDGELVKLGNTEIHAIATPATQSRTTPISSRSGRRAWSRGWC
jgi:hypothetical protein